MTAEQKTELEYLIDLLREASKWNVDQGDDALRLEVDLRINNILSGVEVEGETQVHGEVEINPVLTEDDFRDLEAAKLNEHFEQKKKQKQYTEAKESWGRDRVRVFIDGKPVWKKRSECRQVPRDNSRGGLPWTWKFVGPQDKQVQVESMWAEHENSNKEN